MAKVAFITGATRGIGKQIAIEFAKDGYDIAFNYRKENEDLENIKKRRKHKLDMLWKNGGYYE